MTLKQALGIAAGLVAGGAAVGAAIALSGISPEEWCAQIDRAKDVQKQELFYLEVAQGASVPKEAGGRLLGDCAAGTCTISNDAAPHCAYTYGYDCGPLVDGWRICEVNAHPYFAGGWKAAANAQIRWLGSMSQARAACLVNHTAAKCLQLFDADRRCWKLSGNRVCRYGRVLGTSAPCDYASVLPLFPCVVTRGEGSEELDAAKTWTDEELEVVP